jgi:molybdopterin converting factor small subunit
VQAISATVYIPPPLRRRTGSPATVPASGQSIREIIANLGQSYPGLSFSLCFETGELRPYINIFLNGENIRHRQGLDTPVPSGATIHILQSVAGG